MFACPTTQQSICVNICYSEVRDTGASGLASNNLSVTPLENLADEYKNSVSEMTDECWQSDYTSKFFIYALIPKHKELMG